MKKNLMSIAVAASVAGVASGAMAANYQYVNPEKTGEVILFPFYNADNGNATNMHIVNTTGKAKAVKIRFVEYKNSDEVLDFNLYLSKYDHFAFGVIKNPNGEGAAVITADNSCTVPALGGPNGDYSGTATEQADGSIVRIQPFVNYQYAQSKDVDSSIERTLTGHVEVIEMGVLDNYVASGATKDEAAKTAYASFATHGADGVPANCAGLVKAWTGAGVWGATSVHAGLTAPEGGLYGLAYHINVDAAASFGFEPTAIDNFYDDVVAGAVSLHTDPGNLAPSLNDGDTNALIHAGEGVYQQTGDFALGVQAVSAALATTSLANDVMINPALGGQTDWVVSFPTKRFHVDLAGQSIAAVRPPFTEDPVNNSGAWIGAEKDGTTYVENPACEVVGIVQYDREEKTFVPDLGFSPKPKGQSLAICNEVAVIAHGTGATSAMSVETGLSNLPYSYSEGWQKISFPTQQAVLPAGGYVKGLPAIGFAAYKVNNGAMSYGNAAEHKTENVVS